ncbi:60S ribosomal protein L23a-like [Tupaia chinensis]|uniref:60S ribosomal protein L23a-like n=1 Tax=Tupaia chinensis TaxID=246437 RepID=UPI000FFB4786|nr:60S ribosomal protein L23a-like [Tupaia chinensis]
MKKTEDSNTFVFTVDVKAKKHQIEQAVKKFCHFDVTTVNILIRNKCDHETIKFPLRTESAMKKTEDSNTFVFTVDVKAKKHQIEQAVKKFCHFDVTTVNILIRPDPEKKAYVHLVPD